MSSVIVGFLSGIIGSMGLGGGAVLLIYLSAVRDVSQLKAQGINLLFFIPIGLISVIIYAFKGQILWKTVLIFSAFGLAGAFLGVWLSDFVGTEILGKVFGGLLIAVGLWQIVLAFKKKKAET